MRRMFAKLLSAIILLFLSQTAYSQLISPDKWDSFVEANKAILVSDTFRLQRFEKTGLDNWTYTTHGDCSLIEASESGVPNTSGGKLLKMERDSRLAFESAISPLHQTVKGRFSFSGRNLKKGDYFLVTLNQVDKTDSVKIAEITADNQRFDQKSVQVNRSIYAISFDYLTTSQTATASGYIYMDSVCLFGEIPLYSLFKGKGSWHDTVAWSDLPAERHRHALIKGDVVVTSDTYCDFIDLSGSIRIGPEAMLQMKNLQVHESTSTIINEGELNLDGTIRVNRTFSEKGVWYFVSFPFDVYPDGIDTTFTLKDDEPNTGGNYFYVLTYKESGPNQDQSVNGNWEVLPESAMQSNAPLFKKNQGYLIALDEKASETTLCFSSRPGSVPSTFGKSGTIDISVPFDLDESGKDGGWYLCGNPLPAPLHVRELAHPYLDGFVYVYNGEEYTPIPLDGNYTLPAYSAFFVKARQSVSLTVRAATEVNPHMVLLDMMPLRGEVLSVPGNELPTGNTELLADDFFRIGRTACYIFDAPDQGVVYVFDFGGKSISAIPFKRGESRRIALPEQKGFYILSLEMQNRRKEYKFIR